MENICAGISYANMPKAKAKILVVEDQQPNIIVVTMMLEEIGHSYDVARSSAQALEKIRDGDYALILMDVRMAGRDGIETTQIIRSMEMRGEIEYMPIVALTADGDKERCLESGMDDYILKPITLAVLKQKLRANLE